MDRLLAEQEKGRQRREFSVARIDTLHGPAKFYDANPAMAVRDHELRAAHDGVEDERDALGALVALRHVERVENIDPGYPFRHFGHWLTAQGRKYHQETVVPRLQSRMQPVAPTD